MKVFICYKCSYDFCETWRVLEHVYADELDAMTWVDSFAPVQSDGTTVEWREYDSWIVE
jgi:hypothetical protein